MFRHRLTDVSGYGVAAENQADMGALSAISRVSMSPPTITTEHRVFAT
ncbi:hypothetical protein STXM2123_248 [Streptomyces sp. F-3]|nr:hypothetical protein STXM2123_248 [Streptomyces sp. F-3]